MKPLPQQGGDWHCHTWSKRAVSLACWQCCCWRARSCSAQIELRCSTPVVDFFFFFEFPPKATRAGDEKQRNKKQWPYYHDYSTRTPLWGAPWLVLSVVARPTRRRSHMWSRTRWSSLFLSFLSVLVVPPSIFKLLLFFLPLVQCPPRPSSNRGKVYCSKTLLLTDVCIMYTLGHALRHVHGSSEIDRNALLSL